MHGNVIVVVVAERGEEPDKIRHSGKQRGNVLNDRVEIRSSTPYLLKLHNIHTDAY